MLFIGNSYTGYNNLAGMVSTCATSAGDTITFDTHTPGGSTFSQHSSNSVVEDKIAQGNWDFVVLQEQSQRPAMPDTQVETQVYPHAAKLDSMIRHHNPCAETVFYMTWGRKNGDATNCPTWPPVCTYEGMDSLLHLRYMTVAENNEAIVAPVGAVWKYIRQNFPSIELYNADESHPSLAGSYAAACCFYTTFFRKNPQLITWNSSLDIQTASDIREAVRIVVFEQLGNWFIGAYDPVASFTLDDSDSPNIFFQNLSSNATSFQWLVNGEFVSSNSELIYSFENYGDYEVTLIASHCELSSEITQTFSYLSSNSNGLNPILRVFPNPSQDFLSIELFQDLRIVVVDLFGRTIDTFIWETGLHEINVSDYIPGVYWLTLPDGSSISFIKN